MWARRNPQVLHTSLSRAPAKAGTITWHVTRLNLRLHCLQSLRLRVACACKNLLAVFERVRSTLLQLHRDSHAWLTLWSKTYSVVVMPCMIQERGKTFILLVSNLATTQLGGSDKKELWPALLWQREPCLRHPGGAASALSVMPRFSDSVHRRHLTCQSPSDPGYDGRKRQIGLSLGLGTSSYAAPVFVQFAVQSNLLKSPSNISKFCQILSRNMCRKRTLEFFFKA